MKKTEGFTLLEFILAISIGLMLSTALMQLYLHIKDNYVLQHAMFNVSENGELISQVLRRTIREAGYVACKQPRLSSSQRIKGYRRTDGTDAISISKTSFCSNSSNEETQTFFVADSQRKNNKGMPIHSLYIQELGMPSEELVPGVEGMQIRYRVSSNSFKKSNEITDWSKVLAVEINLLLNSDELLHHPWKIYVGLRNIQ